MQTAAPPTVMQLSIRPVGLAAMVCLLAAGGFWWATQLAKDASVEEGKAKAALVAAQLALKNTQADRQRLEDNLVLFDKLKQTSFVQAPDRLRILEALENATKALPQIAVEWELLPQEDIKPLVDDKTSAPVGTLVRVPMRIRAQAIHEEEWLNLIRRLKNGKAGYFVTGECTYDKSSLSRAQFSVPASNASCNLSWLYAVPIAPVAKPP